MRATIFFRFMNGTFIGDQETNYGFRSLLLKSKHLPEPIMIGAQELKTASDKKTNREALPLDLEVPGLTSIPTFWTIPPEEPALYILRNPIGDLLIMDADRLPGMKVRSRFNIRHREEYGYQVITDLTLELGWEEVLLAIIVRDTKQDADERFRKYTSILSEMQDRKKVLDPETYDRLQEAAKEALGEYRKFIDKMKKVTLKDLDFPEN